MTERELEKILDKLESAKEVRVVTESVAHGENYIDAFGNLQMTAVFDDFLVIEVDGEKFAFKIEGDEDYESVEEISDRIHEKIADIVAEKVEERFQVDAWDGGCDFGCCLFFLSKGKRYRVRFAHFYDTNTTHYKANGAKYTLEDFTVEREE